MGESSYLFNGLLLSMVSIYSIYASICILWCQWASLIYLMVYLIYECHLFNVLWSNGFSASFSRILLSVYLWFICFINSSVQWFNKGFIYLYLRAVSLSIRGSHSSTVYSYHASYRVESSVSSICVVLSYLWVSIPVYLSELNLYYLSFLCSSISILSVRVCGFLLSNLCVNVCVVNGSRICI